MKQVKVKKIKKIPKYSGGTGNAGTSVLNTIASSYTPFSGSISKAPAGGNLTGSPTITPGGKSTSNNYGGYSNTHIPSGLTTGANELIKSTFGIDQNSTAAVMMDSTAQGAELGMSVAGPWGALIGTGVGFALGAFKGDSIDYSKISTTSDIADSYVAGGIFGGGNKDKLLRDAAQYQNSLAATEMTANARNAWASDPRNQPVAQTVKNGGVIIGDPSKGLTRAQLDSREVVTDKHGNNAVRLPYAEGTDSIPAFIQPTYKVFSEDRHYADIAEKIIKGTKEGSRLREIETNKLAMIQDITNINKPSKKGIVRAKDGKIIPYVQLGLSALQALKKEKAETTRLQRPTLKQSPVAVDPLNQLQDAQLGYALANYNTMQGGYTAGQQLAARGAAANNLARRRAQIHQWQTEQQNKNIARNIAAFNTHSNISAEIGNKEIDINDANRAAARNINRENWKALSKNIGMYGRDLEGWNSNAAQIAALEGLGEYAYVNWNDIVKSLNKLTKNGSKQIR